MADPRKLRGRARPRRLTGAYGFQWDYTEPERKAIRDLIVFLEARRVLVVPYEFEIMSHVVRSLIEIRDDLTATLQRLEGGAKSAAVVQEMREAVQRFLIAAGNEQFVTPRVVALLGELRGIFVVNVRVLADTFGIEVRGALAEAIAT
jgi:hypothetical protein